MMIYLDSAATAKYRSVDDIIVDTITTAMRDSWMNPSALYAKSVKDRIDKCRINIANFIGAKQNEIYFTSGASEANNLAIQGWEKEVTFNKIRVTGSIISTRMEHKSILDLLEYGTLNSWHHYCRVDKNGFVDLNHLNDLLVIFGDEPTLVSIQMANNEIGTIHDISRISEIVHKYGGVLHVDATQAFPYTHIDVNELGIDMMSVSGHKLSPVLKGIGFLYKKDCINIQPIIYGAQEDGLRGGTENTFGIIGLNKALEYCDLDSQKYMELCDKRDYFISELVNRFDCKLNGHDVFRLPNNVNVTFPQNIIGENLLYMLDISGIKCSTGSACNSREVVPSHVLKEIGLTDEEAMRTVRFTLTDDITYTDIDYVIKEIDKAIKLLQII